MLLNQSELLLQYCKILYGQIDLYGKLNYKGQTWTYRCKLISETWVLENAAAPFKKKFQGVSFHVVQDKAWVWMRVGGGM